MKHRYNVDHIVPTSRNGTNNEENKRTVDMNWHSALHHVFSNSMPHERIARLLKWDSSVIQEPAFDEIMEVIEKTIEDRRFYISKALRGRFQ